MASAYSKVNNLLKSCVFCVFRATNQNQARFFFNSTLKNEAKPFHYPKYIDRRVSRTQSQKTAFIHPNTFLLISYTPSTTVTPSLLSHKQSRIDSHGTPHLPSSANRRGRESVARIEEQTEDIRRERRIGEVYSGSCHIHSL